MCSSDLLGIEPGAWNLTAPGVISLRDVATRFGDCFSKKVRFTSQESDTALLNNPDRICRRLGAPSTLLESMIDWIAHWVCAGGRNLGKPTHYEVRDGSY